MTTPPPTSMESPFLDTQAEIETSFLGGICIRLQASWRRFQYRRIQSAIRSYDAEKHFLSPMFRPVVGPATMRMAHGEIERNKLPFNAESGRPWLSNSGPLRLAPRSVDSCGEMEVPTVSGTDLPASLRPPPLRQETIPRSS